jgi:hypothetical protein
MVAPSFGLVLNRPFLYTTDRNRSRIRTVLGQGLKEISILNPSDFWLIPLDIAGLLGPVLVSINHQIGNKNEGTIYCCLPLL